MEYNVTEGKVYLITAKTTTTVTDSGYVLRIVAANSQGVVVAISNKLEIVGECDVRPFDVATRTHLELFLSACGITLDSASAQIAEWRSYLPMIQEQVDEETARQVSEEFERAAVEYLVDPTAKKSWNTKKDADGNTVSGNPYHSNPLPDVVVDFNVVATVGDSYNNLSSFNRLDSNSIVFLPNVTDCESAFRSSYFNGYVCFPSATRCYRMFFYAPKYNKPLYLPNATNCMSLVSGSTSVKMYFNNVAILPKCSVANSAFSYTSMSAENISKTLDSLPTWTDGASHVITFTGSTGASELTQDSPSVAAAIAKGWTVEL